MFFTYGHTHKAHHKKIVDILKRRLDSKRIYKPIRFDSIEEDNITEGKINNKPCLIEFMMSDIDIELGCFMTFYYVHREKSCTFSHIHICQNL